MSAFFRIVFCLLICSCAIVAQPQPFRENSKWGIKENDKVIISPAYDTVFNFDAAGKVCMACYKVKVASPNKFIHALTTSYSCNYLNGSGRRLSVKVEGNDTCSIFILGKSTVSLYNDNPAYFTVSVKGKKHLVSKDFKQLTFKGYYEVTVSPDPNYYIVQTLDDSGVTLANLADMNEEQVIPFNYSSIKINPYDSLIIGCSAGIRINGNDDVFNYLGQKLNSWHRHVDMATKNFIIYKLFEPKEYYILYNISTKEEKTLNADEIRPSLHDEILVRIRNDWYLYDLTTNLKKPYKSS